MAQPHPIGFVMALIQSLPILMLGLWAQVPTETTILCTSAVIWALSVLGVVISFGVYRMMRTTVSSSPEARFWALGMVFTLIPLCASQPMNRLLFFPGIGAFALLGLHLSLRPQPARHPLFWIHGPMAACLS